MTHFNRRYVPRVVDVSLLVMSFSFNFSVAPSAHMWKNILALFEIDKEPINPTRFPAPFAPMKLYCCICTDIYSLCLYACVVYYTLFDGKQ